MQHVSHSPLTRARYLSLSLADQIFTAHQSLFLAIFIQFLLLKKHYYSLPFSLSRNVFCKSSQDKFILSIATTKPHLLHPQSNPINHKAGSFFHRRSAAEESSGLASNFTKGTYVYLFKKKISFKMKSDTWKPTLLMVAVQITYSACNVFYKLAINDGMSTIVIAAYRLAFASLTTIPLALIFERNKRPKMTWRVFLLSNLSGLFATLFQNLFYGALVFTSATLVSTIYNLIPTMTFILAVSFGQLPDTTNDLLGVVCVVISCFLFSLWLIIQAKISEVYPCPQSSIALMSTIATVQCFILGFIVDSDLNQWRLDWNIRLITVLFSGILASGLIFFVIQWVVQTKGPLFASAFNPLMLLIVAVVASMLLDEKLNLGSVLGGLFIVCGLYTVLWGKSREAQKNAHELEPPEIFGDSEATRSLLNP